ncbi:hypothetical protein BT67DRAFT_446204 [Trichocladium antarcticum]|uniref:Uncharacterized protein n=1 Tax=Trichocladium antarcticum TaxID=1450529 RepID=A0AAN6UE30_9PEZI|nr:hypothetical protein BT67DRAFT_446204 [Trichocladium antarcticum]
MKHGLVALLGFAWLQLAAGACCRSNKCLKAVVSALGDGIQDCSSHLVVTVTPTASTIIKTVTVMPTEHNTFVDTLVFTETVTTTAATETQPYTFSATVPDATYTDVSTITQTVVVTKAALQTATATADSDLVTTRIYPAKRGETLVVSSFPAYASADCLSFDKYVAACKCAGVIATTVMAEAPSATTMTVSNTANAVTTSVPTTISTTKTVYVSLTAKTLVIETDSVLVTATVQATETAIASSVVTLTETTTTTVVPAAPTCKAPLEITPFKTPATDYGSAPLQIYANLLNGLTGGITWQAASTSTAASAQNKYIWAINSFGYLVLANNVPPYSYQYAAYTSTSAGGSNWPQVNTEASVASQILNGAKIARIKGCINSITGELTLDAAGRTNILWCGQQLWMSYGGGEDINRGVCTKMYPKAVPV